MPTDQQVLTCIHKHQDTVPERRGLALADLCDLLDVPYSTSQLGFVGRYGYTPEARVLARQLQRLRRAGKLQTTQGQRWEVVKQDG